MNTYDLGDEVRLTATITDIGGNLYDPAATLILVQRPDGTHYGYGTSTGWSDQGNWDASANSPSLADGVGSDGQYYTVTAAGSVDFGNGSITFAVGDRVYYNGKAWRRWISPSSSGLVNPSTGVYYIDQYLGIPGNWRYRAEGVSARATEEAKFAVNRSRF